MHFSLKMINYCLYLKKLLPQIWFLWCKETQKNKFPKKNIIVGLHLVQKRSYFLLFLKKKVDNKNAAKNSEKSFE